MRPDFGSIHNQRGIDVGDRITSSRHTFLRLAQKKSRIRPLPLRVGWGEQRTNVRSGNGSEQSVGDGMQQCITIGVASQTMGVRQSYTTNFQGNAGLKFVRVPTVA